MNKKNNKKKSVIALLQIHDDISRCILIQKNKKPRMSEYKLEGNVFSKMLDILYKNRHDISFLYVVTGAKRFSLVRAVTLLANVLSVTWKIPTAQLSAAQNASSQEVISVFLKRKSLRTTAMLVPHYNALPNITISKR